jgi:dihydrofolate synthase / folylpolyglutamate synthase
VVEVGAGGRFDATNVIDPMVSVITSVGLDHLITLGPTIADIAWHKAGIIKAGGTAVIGDLPGQAFSVIAAEARMASVDLIRARDLYSSLPFVPPMASGFRQRNAEVATAVAMVLRQRGFTIPITAIDAGIESTQLPGRFERMPGTVDAPVWIDGAHNEDKIAAVTSEAVHLWREGPLPVIVLGMLSSKDRQSIVANISPAASTVVLTQPFVYGKGSLAAETLADALAAAGFAGAIHVEPDPDAAVRFAQVVAGSEGATVLVTGSMYLAGQVRRLWFPNQDIVLQRTPWPSVTEKRRLDLPRPFGRLVGDKADGERHEATDHQVSAGTDELVIR